MKTLSAFHKRFSLFKFSLFITAALLVSPLYAGYYFVTQEPIVMCSHCHTNHSCASHINGHGHLVEYAGRHGENSYRVSVYQPAAVYELAQQNMWCEKCVIIANSEQYEVYQADPDDAFGSGETYDNPNTDPSVMAGTTEDRFSDTSYVPPCSDRSCPR